jgi:hypothetical protein
MCNIKQPPTTRAIALTTIYSPITTKGREGGELTVWGEGKGDPLRCTAGGEAGGSKVRRRWGIVEYARFFPASLPAHARLSHPPRPSRARLNPTRFLPCPSHTTSAIPVTPARCLVRTSRVKACSLPLYPLLASTPYPVIPLHIPQPPTPIHTCASFSARITCESIPSSPPAPSPFPSYPPPATQPPMNHPPPLPIPPLAPSPPLSHLCIVQCAHHV